jgi:hydroxyethylthiazole kinase-like uncharacterized protein yjeF
MKIFTAEQIRAWDRYTIHHEPISSIDLMERAAKACTDHLLKKFPTGTAFHILCGPGNNGGDGLAIARQLFQAGQTVFLYVSEEGSASEDHRTNIARWKGFHAPTNRCKQVKVFLRQRTGRCRSKTANGLLYRGIVLGGKKYKIPHGRI